MDYTKVPRTLIYKDRKDLKDFGVQTPDTMNHLLFLQLKQQTLMSVSGAREVALRCYNNAYYVCTIILLEANDFPELRISDYVDKILEIEKDNIYTDEVCLVSMAMACLLLARSDEEKYGRNSEIWKAIYDRCTHYQWYHSSETTYFHNMMSLEYCFSSPLPYTEFAPRDIQELLDCGESLKECLSSGKILREAVNILCKNNKQKLALIERLLEPEKKGYGVLDAEVTESYRCLYELRSELTGEPLPDKLPFERKAGAFAPPMLPHYSQDVSNDCSNNVSGSKEADIDLQTRIEELEEQVAHYHDMKKGMALGLNQGQSSLLVKSMAKAFGFSYTNMKKELAPLAHGLFGWGESKLAKYMSTPCDKTERDKLANLFKDVCPKLYDTIMNWGEVPPEETPEETPTC